MTEKMQVTILHAIVEGRVQGVGFRYFVKENADRLHLNGWVRNLYNGNVELTAEGSREALERLLSAVRIGPEPAFVSDVKFDWSIGPARYFQFSFLPTDE
jgi:acylphosphatase